MAISSHDILLGRGDAPVERVGITEYRPEANPVVFRDVYTAVGDSLRAGRCLALVMSVHP
jgi:hypothetical protein